MKDERETRERLLASAQQEFLAKGYHGASLRTICKNAGVTTGALYFFFQDKEELFASLVTPPLEALRALLSAHMQEELVLLDGHAAPEPGSIGDDAYAVRQLIHLLYENYDAFQLLLTGSEGSRLAGCTDEFVALAEQHYRKLADLQAQQLGAAPPDDYTIHWVAHMQTDAFVHLLTHEPDETRALTHLDSVTRYLVAGWQGLFPPQSGAQGAE